MYPFILERDAPRWGDRDYNYPSAESMAAALRNAKTASQAKAAGSITTVSTTQLQEIVPPMIEGVHVVDVDGPLVEPSNDDVNAEVFGDLMMVLAGYPDSIS